MALRYLSIKPNKLKCPAVEAGITGIQAWKKRTHKAAMPMIALRYLETSRNPLRLFISFCDDVLFIIIIITLFTAFEELWQFQ